MIGVKRKWYNGLIMSQTFLRCYLQTGARKLSILYRLVQRAADFMVSFQRSLEQCIPQAD